MHRETNALFQRLGVHIDPRRPALGLSIADQQIIEIAKAISLDARLLVMDEPTAALSGNEVARLFAVARSLRDEGRALVFISHRFDEVFALCDHVTVMRDGSYISTDRVAETTESQIVAKMVGREVGELFPKTPAEIGDVVLDVQGLETAGEFHGVSFQVRAGEIVGLAGLVGAGRSEIARAIFGVDAYDAGSVTLLGKPVPPKDPRAAIRAGMAIRSRGPPPAGPGDPGLGRQEHRLRHPRRADQGRLPHRRRRSTAPRGPGRPASRSRPTPST